MESFHLHRGFTLVELMVVLAIIGVIMSIVLTSQSTFNKTIILKNTAYDIALTLRSAETFGLGSRTVGVTANAGYGIHFQRGSSFILFADTSGGVSCAGMTPDCKPGDYAYTPNADKLVQTYMLGNGITVGDFCAYWNGGKSCASSGSISSLDVVFARPNPNAFIRANGSSYNSACITVTSPQGGAKYISVASSGQITANAAPCP